MFELLTKLNLNACSTLEEFDAVEGNDDVIFGLEIADIIRVIEVNLYQKLLFWVLNHIPREAL